MPKKWFSAVLFFLPLLLAASAFADTCAVNLMPTFPAEQARAICSTALQQQISATSVTGGTYNKGYALGTNTRNSTNDAQYVTGDIKFLALLSYGTGVSPYYDVNNFTTQATRGASFVVFGNNNNYNAGDVRIETGGGSASSILNYLNGGATTSWMVGAHTGTPSTDVPYWSINVNALSPGADNTYNFGASDTRPLTTYLRLTDIYSGGLRFTASNGDIYANTSDAADTQDVRITGGGAVAFDGSRGAALRLSGTDKAGGVAGLLGLDAGAASTGDIAATTHHASAAIRIYPNGTETIQFLPGFLFQAVAAGNESTGAGSAALGANSPAVTLTNPYTWEKVKTSDGSTGYIPVWK